MQLPEGLAMCTAFVVDVERGGLCYSVYVRFSRFERLHAELQRELPGIMLPGLPQKRGPLDMSKWKSLIGNEPTDPRAIEQRTSALDAYLRDALVLPGVAGSRALQELLALPESGESAVRHLATKATEEEEARLHRVNELTDQLDTTNAYVSVLRAAKDRADHRAASLDGLVNASAALLGRQRQGLALARAWRRWGDWRQRKLAWRAAKVREGLTSALMREREEVSRQQVTVEQALREADALRAALASSEAATSSAQEQLRAERRAAAAALAAQEQRSHEELLVAEEARRRAEAAARTAQAEKRQARAAAAHEHATALALGAALCDADGHAAVLDARLADLTTAATARAAQLRAERRRRVLGALSRALRQHADEARLLLLLQSQRERIAATTDELAALRALRAEEFGQAVLEGPWLAPKPPEEPPPPPPDPLPPAPDAEERAALAARAFQDELRCQWLGAMSHAI